MLERVAAMETGSKAAGKAGKIGRPRGGLATQRAFPERQGTVLGLAPATGAAGTRRFSAPTSQLALKIGLPFGLAFVHAQIKFQSGVALGLTEKRRDNSISAVGIQRGLGSELGSPH